MAIYNVEDYIEEAIDSVINQTFDFNKVQLILVDDGSTDSSKEIALNYQSKYPNNILVLSKENNGPGSGRNLGLKHATGKFVNFLDADDYLSKNALKNVYKFFLKHKEIDVVAIPRVFEHNNKPLNLNKKFNKNQIIDLKKNFYYIQNSISSTFIKRELLEGYAFDEQLVYSEDTLLINKILLEKMKIGFVKNSTYYFRKRRDKSALYNIYRLDRRFFTERLNLFFKELINYSINKFGEVPNFIQSLLSYNIQVIFKTKDIEGIYQDKELDEFWDCLLDVLSYIDQDIIFNHEYITDDVKTFIFTVINNDLEIVKEEDDVLLMSNNYVVDYLSNHEIFLDIVEIKDGFFNISGYLLSNYPTEKISIIGVKEKISLDNSFSNKYSINNSSSNQSSLEKTFSNKSEIFKGKYFSYTSRKPRHFLSNPFEYYYSFDLSIPIDCDNFRVSLKVVYNEGSEEIEIKKNNIQFRNYASLSYTSHCLVKDSKMLLFTNQFFYLMPFNSLKRLKYEVRSILKILRDRKKNYIWGLIYRIGYLCLYPFLINKEIWIFLDRKDRADDNAEHLFKYALNQNDNVEKYFAVQRGAPDYYRLREIYGGNVVRFGSVKHRFLYLFADKNISSQTTINYVSPFTPIHFYCAGLLTVRHYFLQHGIIQQNLSSYLTKYDKNLELIVTSSDLERESLFDEGYNFDGSIIKTFGLPRYDNLNNQNLKKQIVIMPTWRNYITGEYELINSEYFRRFNNLINNKKLINHAKDKGYTIIFKPHPNLSRYIDLFDINEYVEIDQVKKYQEIFNESALLITDFSTVAFDFSYLKKPIIYYQYAKEHHFDLDSGYFKYDSMGFGDVIQDEDELIKKIIYYIDNDCEMEEKYKERVNSFFKFNDRNNCKRSYDWIKEH